MLPLCCMETKARLGMRTRKTLTCIWNDLSSCGFPGVNVEWCKHYSKESYAEAAERIGKEILMEEGQ